MRWVILVVLLAGCTALEGEPRPEEATQPQGPDDAMQPAAPAAGHELTHVVQTISHERTDEGAVLVLVPGPDAVALAQHVGAEVALALPDGSSVQGLLASYHVHASDEVRVEVHIV